MLETEQNKIEKKKEESVFYAFLCFLINFWSQESKNVHWQFHTLLHLLFAFITCMAVFINGKHKHKWCNILLWSQLCGWEINAYVQNMNSSQCTSAFCFVKAGIWTRLLSAYMRSMRYYTFMYLDSYVNLFFTCYTPNGRALWFDFFLLRGCCPRRSSDLWKASLK